MGSDKSRLLPIIHFLLLHPSRYNILPEWPLMAKAVSELQRLEFEILGGMSSYAV